MSTRAIPADSRTDEARPRERSVPSLLRDGLLRWFRANARDLPWRRTTDPWAIWVSEVMLQQTRVETVLRHYPRFLARFPDVASLARASEDEVLGAWSGLGYYRRARLLHQGARLVVERHGARIPERREERLALPGVGRYTAGAIGSIAFGLPEPVLDGNVARVLARFHGVDAPLGSRAFDAQAWSWAEAWARGPAPGALNQALMELGATVCTPRSPACENCPLRSRCFAHRYGYAETLPVRGSRREPKAMHVVAVVAREPSGRVLFERADGEKGLGGNLFRGLWNVPVREGRGLREARALAGALGANLEEARRALVEHVLTHRKLFVRVFRASVADAPAGCRFFDEGSLEGVGISALTRKILAAADASAASPTTSTSSRRRRPSPLQ